MNGLSKQLPHSRRIRSVSTFKISNWRFRAGLKSASSPQRRQHSGLPAGFPFSLADLAKLYLLQSGPPRTRVISEEPHIVTADHSLPFAKAPCYLYVPQGKNTTVIVDTSRSVLDLVERSPWKNPLPPQKPAYKIRQVEGKGFGMVATRPIKAGELVIAERPLYVQRFDEIALQNPTDYTHFNGRLILGALEGLAPASQDALRALKNVQGAENHVLWGILKTNAIQHHMDADYQGPDYAGLFPSISRANHSCTPNLQFIFSANTFAGEFRTVKTVAPKEELCMNYTNVLAPRLMRQRDLELRYGFRCECTACSAGGSESDRRRAQISEAIQVLEAAMVKDGHAGNAPISATEMEEALKLAEREGLMVNAAQILVYGSSRLLWLRDIPRAKQWSVAAGKKMMLFEGKQSPSVKKMSEELIPLLKSLGS
ncbi:hypothetical protein DFH06DRAFT_1104032 [Mycena polygramma]|nr:hypothetical protein DFH06DRAFT_1104032 [Mycena polygramma]